MPTAYDPEVQIISHVVAGFRWAALQLFRGQGRPARQRSAGTRRCGHVCDAAVARARHRYGGRSMSTRFAEWEKPSEGISTSRPHWQQRTAQAHRRLTKLGIPSRLIIDDFGHSTESGRGVKQTEDLLAEPSRIAQRSSVLKPSGWGGQDKVASPTRVDRAPAAGLPAVGLTAILSSNAATLLGLQRQSSQAR